MTDKCTPALRALLRVAAHMFPGQVDGQTDQQRLHAAVLVTPPPFRGILETVLSSPEQSSVLMSELQELLTKKRNFQGSSQRGKHGVLFPVFSGSRENRRNETNSRSVPVQQSDHGETFPHADSQIGDGERLPE
ncbi:hypothetical protein ATANTOWER_016515 [Ataeniobius toweri]|uniref:Uncharacterized protein n=1 Tax=Ataeniobius toweri TaxID=208326 RepID=A0ABU7AFL2_9TELE|nr:hypothetical protein [Ataeniobius toweri]